MKDKQAFWGKTLGWVLTISAVVYVLIQHWPALVGAGR